MNVEINYKKIKKVYYKIDLIKPYYINVSSINIEKNTLIFHMLNDFQSDDSHFTDDGKNILWITGSKYVKPITNGGNPEKIM